MAINNVTNLNTIAKSAITASKVTTPQFPAQLIVAQFAIESDWGKKKIGQNNYFGMTFVPSRHTMSVWSPTTEYLTAADLNKMLETRIEDSTSVKYLSSKIVEDITSPNYGKWQVQCERLFADFPSLADCMTDVVKLVGCVYSPYKSIYKDCWRAFKADGDWRKFASCYGSIYATGGGYANLVIQIAEQKNVRDALRQNGYTYK